MKHLLSIAVIGAIMIGSSCGTKDQPLVTAPPPPAQKAAPQPPVDQARLKRIKELLNQFCIKDPEERASAANSLMEMQAVPDLIGLLQDADPGSRSLSAWVLGELGAKEAAPAITKLLQDPDPDVREAAQEGLKALERPPDRKPSGGLQKQETDPPEKLK